MGSIPRTLLLHKYFQVDQKELNPAIPMSSSTKSAPDAGPRVKIDVSDLEKDWDVSEDPELQKVLNVAKLLGRTNIPTAKTIKKAGVEEIEKAKREFGLKIEK